MKHSPITAQALLYSLPTVNSQLSAGAQIAIQMAALSSRLVAVERTRCSHPNNRPENDAEHSLMLAKVAPELAQLLYPELDENLVARFAALHDDVEAYVGDTPTDILAGLDQSAKDALEKSGLLQLQKDYAHLPSYVRLVKVYETQSVAEARFVRAVDKLMVLLIHFPNKGVGLKSLYSYESFLDSEQKLLARDSYKYGEFELIKRLRQELSLELAVNYLAG